MNVRVVKKAENSVISIIIVAVVKVECDIISDLYSLSLKTYAYMLINWRNSANNYYYADGPNRHIFAIFERLFSFAG